MKGPRFNLRQLMLAVATGSFVGAALFVFTLPLELIGLLAGILIVLTHRDNPERMVLLLAFTFAVLWAVSIFIFPYSTPDGPSWGLNIWE